MLQEPSLILNECFYSIQGEGIYTGQPTIFIRTVGCNIRCSYCDTMYAVEVNAKKDAYKATFTELVSAIENLSSACKLICLTGGEPLIQKDTITVCKLLAQMGYHIEIETNGTIPLDFVRAPQVVYNMDVKTPSAEVSTFTHWANMHKLRSVDQVKFVVSDRTDFEFACTVLKEFPTKAQVYFSPVWASIEPRELVDWILADPSLVDTRLQLQIHKLIWDPKKRGV